MMKTHVQGVWLCMFTLMAGLVTNPALGRVRPVQDLATWDNVKRLSMGQEIRVVLNDAKSYQGKFQSVSGDTLMVRLTSGDVSFEKQNIIRIFSKTGSPRLRNALVGVALGAGAGLGIGAAADHGQGNCSNGGFLCGGKILPNVGKEVLTPVGAIVGAAVGAVIPTGGWHDVYRIR